MPATSKSSASEEDWEHLIVVDCGKADFGFWNPWWDRNLDGAFSPVDIVLLGKWVFLWPGDVLIWLLLSIGPSVATYHQLDCGTLGGPLSWFAAIFFWIATGLTIQLANAGR